MGAALAFLGPLLRKPLVWAILGGALLAGAGYVYLAPKVSAWLSGRSGLAQIDTTVRDIGALQRDRAAQGKVIRQLSADIARLRQEAAASQARVADLQARVDAANAARADQKPVRSLREAKEALDALYRR
ncbi:MAG: hypothetical protein Q8Q14_17020 [Gemmatimonadales bacterium]|nr:hypothetical protein [Gemmatimonadales bacterium]